MTYTDCCSNQHWKQNVNEKSVQLKLHDVFLIKSGVSSWNGTLEILLWWSSHTLRVPDIAH